MAAAMAGSGDHGAGIRLRLLERWIVTAQRGDAFVYHRGELAAAKLSDPDLSATAERMLELSTGRYDLVSRCGHVRGLLVGSGDVELTTRRERGELVYLARRL